MKILFQVNKSSLELAGRIVVTIIMKTSEREKGNAL